MPVEYVRGEVRILDNGSIEDNPTPQDAEDLVGVGWKKGCYVQVGTLSRATVTHDTIDEGHWVDLDRQACNELIRRLRKARDDAYGRDE